VKINTQTKLTQMIKNGYRMMNTIHKEKHKLKQNIAFGCLKKRETQSIHQKETTKISTLSINLKWIYN
jgi:hypothetical protein